MLWPGEGRVGARSAFNVTLLRLRRQLRTEDLLVTSDSGVSLNPRLVHVDRWQLEACLATAEMASEDRTRDVMDAVVDRYFPILDALECVFRPCRYPNPAEAGT
jgi:DNA-binding SARP family transcriptional activator